MNNKYVVEILYTNWKGTTSTRHIVPKRIYFGSTEWHTEDQWLIEAFDIEKQAGRTFALKDIHKWEVRKDNNLENNLRE